ncbi:MAG TPA: hypothetical protein PKM59_14610, partial [Thermodesulfobacteriota bacterium]|nr:hypothetical protein [Thermodesulfobacteriota bacterium]
TRANGGSIWSRLGDRSRPEAASRHPIQIAVIRGNRYAFRLPLHVAFIGSSDDVVGCTAFPILLIRLARNLSFKKVTCTASYSAFRFYAAEQSPEKIGNDSAQPSSPYRSLSH